MCVCLCTTMRLLCLQATSPKMAWGHTSTSLGQRDFCSTHSQWQPPSQHHSPLNCVPACVCMLLCRVEKLMDAYGQPTRAIWVVNNGLSLSDGIPNEYISGWVQDALDSVEFITGPASSEWGSIRARMGHPEPFLLQYVAINNEVCGRQYYEDNYKSFYTAFKAAYPHITLISNCPPDQIHAEVELWSVSPPPPPLTTQPTPSATNTTALTAAAHRGADCSLLVRCAAGLDGW